MTPIREQFEKAIDLFDEANSQDPHIEEANGEQRPKELLYGERMTTHLAAFAPDAPEAVQLAVRAQHIRRWEIARDEYPEGRRGYLDWRKDLGRFHAKTAGEILHEVGYDEEMVERVGALLRKEELKANPETQLLEDVICLVFLEHYSEEFAAKHPEDKMVRIIRKTWRKMSPAGQEAALALELPEAVKALVEKALA